jgi:hypothetical protein
MWDIASCRPFEVDRRFGGVVVITRNLTKLLGRIF